MATSKIIDKQAQSIDQGDLGASSLSGKFQELMLGAAILVAGVGGCTVNQNKEGGQEPDSSGRAIPTESMGKDAREIQTNGLKQLDQPRICVLDPIITPFVLAEYQTRDGNWQKGFLGKITTPLSGRGGHLGAIRGGQREQSVFLRVLNVDFNIDNSSYNKALRDSVEKAFDAAMNEFPTAPALNAAEIQQILAAGRTLEDTVVVFVPGPDHFWHVTESESRPIKLHEGHDLINPGLKETATTFENIKEEASRAGKGVMFVTGKILLDEVKTFR
jgi:hypothetical protein